MDTNPGGENSLLVNNGDGRYLRYFADLDRSLRLATVWLSGFKGGSLDGSWHAHYMRGLAACFGMLRARYTFETNDSVMVDLSQSGCPHSYMLARIATDRAEAVVEHLKGESLGLAQYKVVFLDDLFETGVVNTALLNKIACAQYAQVVANMDGAFDPRFMCGDPDSIDAKAKRYTLQWGAFDPSSNLPVLCGMVFEYGGNDLTRALAALKLVLRHETAAGISIALLAGRIDSGATEIRPVALTRATIGPIYLPGLSAPSDIPIVLKASADDVLIDITIDQTHAVSSRKTSSLAVRFGVIAAERQVFAIRADDPVCFERGAHSVERILILPHRTLQHMNANERSGMKSSCTFVPYTQQGEIQ